jgi:hypothetical protein
VVVARQLVQPRMVRERPAHERDRDQHSAERQECIDPEGEVQSANERIADQQLEPVSDRWGDPRHALLPERAPARMPCIRADRVSVTLVPSAAMCESSTPSARVLNRLVLKPRPTDPPAI